MVRAPVDPEGEAEEEEDRGGPGALHFVGTVSNPVEEDRPYVLEEYLVSSCTL